MKYVRKRDGRIAEWDRDRITIAISKAFHALGSRDGDICEQLTKQIEEQLQNRYGDDGVPTVEEIQDIVENTMMSSGYYEEARAYILYRDRRKAARELSFSLESGDMVEGFIDENDWMVRENANMTKSMQALNFYLSSKVTSTFWLTRIYPSAARKSHISGDLHIHDLGILGPYCVGWDLRQVLWTGFPSGVSGKLTSGPAKHFRTALKQSVNDIFTKQGEAAGAQAYTNVDTLFAPYIHYDRLNDEQIEQCMQEYVYDMNIATRVGGQTPFSNISLDVEVPKFMADEKIVHSGKYLDDVYGDFQDEVDQFNVAFAKVMSAGDHLGRVFTFPIPTYSITDNDKWEDNVEEAIFRMTAKYGIPYFANFMNSDMKPEDVRSMCCHLRLDNNELSRRGGGFFGANPLTGSVGVVTINMSRIGYESKTEDEYFDRLDELMDIAKTSLMMKKKTIERLTENGLYPYSKVALRHIMRQVGSYWGNHFLTVGLIGMNESCLNFLGEGIETPGSLKFSIKILQHMNERLLEFQEEKYNKNDVPENIWNLEATPAEGTSYRLALEDKKKYPDIIVANEKYLEDGADPFYTNSTQVPVDHDMPFGGVINHQNQLQPLYTGGSVYHNYMGEANSSWEGIAKMVRRFAEHTEIPYYTITPTFSVCPSHGYVSGEHWECPTCGKECEVYSRIVGYFRPIKQWNKGKQSEHKIRKFMEAVQ